MAGATVLGKRTRSSAQVQGNTRQFSIRRSSTKRRDEEPHSISTRSKRRDLGLSHEKTIVIHEDQGDGQDQDHLQTDELNPDAPALENTKPTKAATACSPPKGDRRHKASGPASEHAPLSRFEPRTPQSNRYYDALSENLTTPTHRIGLLSKPLTPQSHRGPTAPHACGRNIYQQGRQLFTRGSSGSALVGRDTERAELQTFLAERVSQGRNGCLYVSGPPGTGKSAFVTEVCRQTISDNGVKYAYANCMSMKNATDVYVELLNELQPGATTLTHDSRRALLKAFSDPNGSRSYVVVLDEIDQLLNLDLAVLYSLFEMSFSRQSRLVLVGIANALDLTDRFLPRLKARNMKPQLLPFLPYSAPQIASIISARCRSLLAASSAVDAKFTPLLLSPAITLISKKVSSQTGDLRKAFDIAQRVVDVVEAEAREKFTHQQPTPQSSPVRSPLGENPNLSSPLKPMPAASASQRLAELTAENAPRATLAHVVRVTSAAFGNGTSQRLKGLNLQQKAILCSLFALEQKKRLELADLPQTPSKSGRGAGTPSRSASASPTMRVLFEAYSSLCKRDNLLHALSNTEFRDVVGNLETLSLVASADGRSGSLALSCTPSKRGLFAGAVKADDKRMSACVGLQELEAAVEGIGSGILKRILSSYDVL